MDPFIIGQLCGNLTDEGLDDLGGCLDGGLVNVPIKVSVVKRKKRGVKKGVNVKKKIIFQ